MAKFPSDWDLKNVVKELSQGRELAKQLQIHLSSKQSSSHEVRDILIQNILNSYDQALSLLKHCRAGGEGPSGVAADSPLVGSPRSDDSDQDLKDQASLRKRKSTAQKVRVFPGLGIEGQLDDGYSWRKYGQKDILGAKWPRGYYRCTHRHAQGCLATKQVQRSDNDPTTFEIVYKRKHTCKSPLSSNCSNSNTSIATIPRNPPNEHPTLPSENPENQQLFNVQTGIRVITPELGHNEYPSLDQFNFPSSSTIGFQDTHVLGDDNNVLGNYSISTLMSPATSGPDFFSISPNVMNDEQGGLIHNFPTSESELSPIVAAMASTQFPFGSPESSSDFSFGNPGYFP